MIYTTKVINFTNYDYKRYTPKLFRQQKLLISLIKTTKVIHLNYLDL